MSRRHFRRLYGGPTLPPVDSDDDTEYEPLYAKHTVLKYQGLELSSDSDKEEEAHITTEEESDVKPVNVKQIKKKRNKKKTKKSKAGTRDGVELDEIDQSVMEVNALLGSPSPAPEPVQPTLQSLESALMTVQLKYLDYETEDQKKFGPYEDEKLRKKQRHAMIKHFGRKFHVLQIPPRFLRMTKIGLSMSILQRDKDYTYFAFDHLPDYQQYHKDHLDNEGRVPHYKEILENGPSATHVEWILETADVIFEPQINEHTRVAIKLLEHIVALMHYVAHPSFALASRQTRLEYIVLENRPYHVAMLKFAYVLGDRACCRTAMEVCKLLLNLDPTDPLAVLFCIDYFAIRAEEYQWLHDAVKLWQMTRDADYLFNLQYSFALAMYHIVIANKGDMKVADEALQEAILRFPSVVIEMIKCASKKPSSRLMSHPLYTEFGSDKTPRKLKNLMHFYAKRTVQYWRPAPIIEWVMSNALSITDIYDNDLEMQAKARTYSDRRMMLFRGWPTEIARHVCIIYPMLDKEERVLGRVNATRSFNPLPPMNSVNRYRYKDWEEQRDPSGVLYGTFFNYFMYMWNRQHVHEIEWEREQLQEEVNLGNAEPRDPMVANIPPGQRPQRLRNIHQAVEAYILGVEHADPMGDEPYDRRLDEIVNQVDHYPENKLADEEGHDDRMNELGDELVLDGRVNELPNAASDDGPANGWGDELGLHDRVVELAHEIDDFLNEVSYEVVLELIQNEISIDLDLDGSVDELANETGHDGSVDELANETGHDGSVDELANETGHDGSVDELANEAGHDGSVDELANETGHDGSVDVLVYEAVHDGRVNELANKESHDIRVNQLAQEAAELQQNTPTALTCEGGTADDQKKPPTTPE